MKPAARSTKRERPADGGMVWHDRFNAFQCLGCGEFEHIGNPKKRSPEALATRRQLEVIDHAECWKYDDPKMAADARRYRKKKTLQQNIAAQRVSWRGRS